MTTQKSPEDVAQNVLIEYQRFLKDYPTTSPEICSYRMQCFIAAAIKAERENIQHTYKQQNIRMTNNRLVLPDEETIKLRATYLITEYGTQRANTFKVDTNWVLNEIKSLNDGRVKPLELPGYANQCAHDVSPSDFDRGAEYGFNKCLNEIYEMNPYLKLDEK